ncbi:MAG: hypothetical protein ACLFWD_10785 [Anaerolineales bacterium]
MKTAELTEGQLEKLQELESDLDENLVAMEYTSNLADLNEDQLAKVQSLEDDLDVVLLAHAR